MRSFGVRVDRVKLLIPSLIAGCLNCCVNSSLIPQGDSKTGHILLPIGSVAFKFEKCFQK